MDTLPPCRCKDFSLEVEARKHAEHSEVYGKVAGVLPDPSIPDFGIREEILFKKNILRLQLPLSLLRAGAQGAFLRQGPWHESRAWYE